MTRLLGICVVVGIIFGLWQGLVVLADLPAFILPSPMRVGQALWGNAGLIAGHAMVTLSEILIGLGLGTILGAATAIGLAMSPLARLVVRPMIGGGAVPQGNDSH